MKKLINNIEPSASPAPVRCGWGRTLCAFLGAVLLFTACSDFTDIKPKGKNLLSSTTDLDLLFNNEMSASMTDMNDVGGDVLYTYSSIPAMLSVDNPSRSAYLIGWKDTDVDIKRLELLTTSDSYYTNFYSYIGRIANPVLQQLNTASGSDAAKNALRAEALTLRAYSHFMLLQKYAKAFDPATAATDPAIVYMTEDVDIATPQPKKTVEEAYELALKDINAAIDLNALPVEAAAKTRFNKAAAYTVKAHICMAMRDYANAEAAAKEAIAVQGDLYDYWAHATTANSYGGQPYLTATVDSRYSPESYLALPDFVIYNWVQPASWNAIETGYATRDLMPTFTKLYKGFAGGAYEDYGAILGISGWQAGFDTEHYINTSGLCAPMMYLYCAECELRAGHVDAAMGYLDVLRAKRLPADGFQPFKGIVTSMEAAKEKLKATSFAENLWTGWNFIQRKRWNSEEGWSETLTRTISGTTYTLAPNSNLWVFPFPNSARAKNENLTSNKNR